MNPTKVHLSDRTLWFDGDSVYSADTISEQILTHEITYVDRITDEIREFNLLNTSSKELKLKEKCSDLDLSWNIPEKYLKLDVLEVITDKLKDYLKRADKSERSDIIQRVLKEYEIFEEKDSIVYLRLVIYIVDILTEKNIAWGVGRGSAVSCFIFYLLGLHDIDSFKYKLDYTDFFH